MKINFLPRRQMTYASSCDQELAAYTCDPCPSEREFGRVRSVALISKEYLATLLAAPTLAATWQTGIDNSQIVIIPMSSGSYEPGDPKELKGFGDNKSSNGPREMTLSWFDPNYKDNYAFYNGIGNITNKVPAFRTSSLVHIFDTTATIVAKDPVEDDLESEVIWNATAKVISSNLPSKHDAANLATIFKCTT